MKAQLTRLATVVVMLAMVAACSHTARPGRDDNGSQPQTRIRVENQAFLDMTVYVLSDGGGRQRLGTVTGNTSQEFVIPAYLVGPANSLRCLIEPIGSTRAAITTSLSIEPGQAVTLTIPPNP